jgi:MinD-like ATPase involved in chromosome partitioning or flagellar assembly
MSTLTVTIHSPFLSDGIDLELPANVPVGELMPTLVEALHLPANDYCLICRLGPLDDGETLLIAQVLTGEVLTLLPVQSEEVPPLDGEAEEPGSARGTDSLHRRQTTRALQDVPLTYMEQIAARPLIPDTSRLVAFWSGPAGGSGQTTLALAFAIRAAERGRDVAFLAFSEPAVSSYLRLPRIPNAQGFFQSGRLAESEQEVTWRTESGSQRKRRSRDGQGKRAMRVILGPTRPSARSADRQVEGERVAALVAAARAAYSLVVVDAPPLTADWNPWVEAPLFQADDLVQVASPTVVGVAATVETLAFLRDLRTPVRAHLAIVRRAAHGLAARDFVAGVRSLWESSPNVDVEVGLLPELTAALDRGELLDLVVGGERPHLPYSSGGRELWRAAEVLIEKAGWSG